VKFQIGLYCTLVRSPPPFFPSAPSQPHLQQLQEVSLFFFIQIHEVHPPYSLTYILFIHPLSPLPQVTHTHTVPILQSCLFLTKHSITFQGFSRCVPLCIHSSLGSSTCSGVSHCLLVSFFFFFFSWQH
jgi:hypothetical protein